jgi:hypothetical protein
MINKCLIDGKNISIRGNLNIKIYPDGFGFIIAECLDLDTTAHGLTEEEAIKELQISNELYFEELIDKGELSTTLAKLGWKVNDNGESIVIVPSFLVKFKEVGIDQFLESKQNKNNKKVNA